MTPLGEVADLLGSADDEIEVCIGRNLYVVHKSEDILGDSSETTKSSAAEQMLRYAGAWKDHLDVDELKHQIYADRDRS